MEQLTTFTRKSCMEWVRHWNLEGLGTKWGGDMVTCTLCTCSSLLMSLLIIIVKLASTWVIMPLIMAHPRGAKPFSRGAQCSPPPLHPLKKACWVPPHLRDVFVVIIAPGCFKCGRNEDSFRQWRIWFPIWYWSCSAITEFTLAGLYAHCKVMCCTFHNSFHQGRTRPNMRWPKLYGSASTHEKQPCIATSAVPTTTIMSSQCWLHDQLVRNEVFSPWL